MKKRFNNLSIYRIVATICILQFHIFYILYNRDIPYETLLSKGVQGLTALSGFLYSQKLITDNKKFYISNFLKLIIPALVAVLFMVGYDLIYMLITSNWSFMAFVSPRAFDGRLISQADNFYYLGYIIICYLITPILQRQDKWSHITSIAVLLIEMLVGFFFGPAMIAISYIVGYYVGRRSFTSYVDTSSKYKTSSLLIWTTLLLASLGLYILIQFNHFGGDYLLTHLYGLTDNILVTTFGISSFFFIILILRFLNRYEGFYLFKYTDRLSFIIYLMNEAYMCGAMRVESYINIEWLMITLVYIFTIATSILLLYLSDLVLKLINKPKLKNS